MTILLSSTSGFVAASLFQCKGRCAMAVPRVFGLSNQTHFATAVVDVHAVVHLAASVPLMPDADPLAAFRRVDVSGALNFLRRAAAAGVKRFVFVRWVKVNGECTQIERIFSEMDLPNPQDTYGQSNYHAEVGLQQVAEETDIEVVIIPSPLVYGPGVKANFAALMAAVWRGWLLPLGAVHNPAVWWR